MSGFEDADIMVITVVYQIEARLIFVTAALRKPREPDGYPIFQAGIRESLSSSSKPKKYELFVLLKALKPTRAACWTSERFSIYLPQTLQFAPNASF
jgi:hypothetical protein